MVNMDGVDMLVVNNIGFHYKQKRNKSPFLLNDINFNLEKGCILGLLGLKGAGKTTLMDLIRGKYTPKVGSILYEGVEIDKDSWEVLQKIAYVSDEVDFLKFRTLRENAELFGGLYEGFSFSSWNDFMFDFGFCADKLEYCYGSLRSDEKIIFQLAFALSYFPTILLLDVVSINIDQYLGTSWMSLIKQKVDSGEISVIIAMESIREVDDILDCILELDRGNQKMFVDKNIN